MKAGILNLGKLLIFVVVLLWASVWSAGCKPIVTQELITLPDGSEPLVNLARRDLAQNLGIAQSAIKLTSVEVVNWADTSLACPQPGEYYAQVITPGFNIKLEAGGITYEYHTDRVKRVVQCQKITVCPVTTSSTGDGTG